MKQKESISQQSYLLELLWKMRICEPNQSVASMLKELRLTNQAGWRKGVDGNPVKCYDVKD